MYAFVHFFSYSYYIIRTFGYCIVKWFTININAKEKKKKRVDFLTQQTTLKRRIVREGSNNFMDSNYTAEKKKKSFISFYFNNSSLLEAKRTTSVCVHAEEISTNNKKWSCTNNLPGEGKEKKYRTMRYIGT